MTASADTAAVVALLRNGHRQWSEYADLLEDTGSGQEVLEREHGLLAHELLEQARAEIAHWTGQRIQLLTLLDAGYPENLRAAHDRPPLIFVLGGLEAADGRAVSVIGSRRASAEGREVAAAIARHLVEAGYTVTSGLAAGIDTAAHEAALEHGGRTLAVVGTGVMRCYPEQNRHLLERITRSGAVISQFWPEEGPSRQNFPLRNAVMSGLSLANVLVEASHTSGARTQARLSLAQGRPVLLVPSLLKQQWARDLSARPGVHVVRAPAEVPEVVERLSAETLSA